MATAIKRHDCPSKQQDALHGANQRVFNSMKKEGHWRCTVCSKEVEGGSSGPALSAKPMSEADKKAAKRAEEKKKAKLLLAEADAKKHAKDKSK